MKKRFKKLALIGSLVLGLGTVSVGANSKLPKFNFNLRMWWNSGRAYSSNVFKTDSEWYGAATTYSNDLASNDKVYYRIHRRDWKWSKKPVSGYYRVTGNGTINIWYTELHQDTYHCLEGDTDVYDARVSGVWEP